MIVALFVDRGGMNFALQNILSHFPKQPNSLVTVENKKINPLDLFPAKSGYYTYTGSMTTPPCKEEVKWVILNEPIEASIEQIVRITSFYRDNARPIQPLNGRKIKIKLS